MYLTSWHYICLTFGVIELSCRLTLTNGQVCGYECKPRNEPENDWNDWLENYGLATIISFLPILAIMELCVKYGTANSMYIHKSTFSFII